MCVYVCMYVCVWVHLWCLCDSVCVCLCVYVYQVSGTEVSFSSFLKLLASSLPHHPPHRNILFLDKSPFFAILLLSFTPLLPTSLFHFFSSFYVHSSLLHSCIYCFSIHSFPSLLLPVAFSLHLFLSLLLLIASSLISLSVDILQVS